MIISKKNKIAITVVLFTILVLLGFLSYRQYMAYKTNKLFEFMKRDLTYFITFFNTLCYEYNEVIEVSLDNPYNDFVLINDKPYILLQYDVTSKMAHVVSIEKLRTRIYSVYTDPKYYPVIMTKCGLLLLHPVYKPLTPIADIDPPRGRIIFMKLLYTSMFKYILNNQTRYLVAEHKINSGLIFLMVRIK